MIQLIADGFMLGGILMGMGAVLTFGAVALTAAYLTALDLIARWRRGQ